MTIEQSLRLIIREELARALNGHKPKARKARVIEKSIPVSKSRLLAFLDGKPPLPVSAIATALRLSKDKAARELKALRDDGKVRMKGNRRSAVWVAM